MVGVGRMMVWMMMMWRVRSEVMVGTRLKRMRRSEGVVRVRSVTSVVWVMVWVGIVMGGMCFSDRVSGGGSSIILRSSRCGGTCRGRRHGALLRLTLHSNRGVSGTSVV